MRNYKLKDNTDSIIINFLYRLFHTYFFYNISSNLKFFYFDLKNQYTKDDKYLAVVTGNGLWIRDEVGEFINYINAENLENDNLNNVTITQFNKNFEMEKVIISEKVSIKTKNWILEKPLCQNLKDLNYIQKF